MLSLRDIDSAVTAAFSLSPGMLQRRTTASYISLPRMVAMALARELTRHPYSKIGGFYGLSTWTAQWASRRVPSLAQADSGLSASIQRCRQIIDQNGPWMAAVARDFAPELVPEPVWTIPAAPETSRRLFVVAKYRPTTARVLPETLK